jgi:hypothetical protein
MMKTHTTDPHSVGEAVRLTERALRFAIDPLLAVREGWHVQGGSGDLLAGFVSVGSPQARRTLHVRHAERS